MCNTHRHIKTITSALQCCTRITHRSTSAASELFGCCGALQKPDNHLSNTIHRAQQGCDNNVASVKSKLSHRLGEMGLPHSECFFQPVHGSFHQPSAVCSWTKLAWRSHQHPLSHGSMKERSTDITSSFIQTSRKSHQKKNSKCQRCRCICKDIAVS